MHNFQSQCISVIGAVTLGFVAGCVSPRTDAPFAKYDDAKEVTTIELARTSQSWDGAELPNYPVGKPELIVKRYVFPRGSKLGWHHHPVMNYGILQQGDVINELPLVLECELVSMNEENCNVVGKILNCAVEESAITDGKPDADKMKPICFDTCQHRYRLMGEVVAEAFSCGQKLVRP